jgi:hypothetical protein
MFHSHTTEPQNGENNNILNTTDTINNTNCYLPQKGTKFRYIINGIPTNKKYIVEEARWSDEKQQFISEVIHSISGITLKQWLGYVPVKTGEIKIVMWLYLPCHIYSNQELKSPLYLWGKNKKVFVPFSLEALRHFPNGDCQEQASQIPTR